MKAKLLLIFFLLAVLTQTTFAQLHISELEKQLQEELDNIVQTDNLPGATLAIVLPDDQILSLSAGYADKEAQTPMLPGARMFSGSVGKTFVAAVLLQIMAEKNIALDRYSSWILRLDNYNYNYLRHSSFFS